MLILAKYIIQPSSVIFVVASSTPGIIGNIEGNDMLSLQVFLLLQLRLIGNQMTHTGLAIHQINLQFVLDAE